ncbi:hypothetical protein BBK14_27695 [Parafrankia soli]|uniref:STAS domain-containing protein n=1 Tax=Parafrankia soli TaxID=2599596 RepID=A0A1S1PFN2_9ACTN|nr:hypothetical protein BBK14_27695 [Parafrankia soli]
MGWCTACPWRLPFCRRPANLATGNVPPGRFDPLHSDVDRDSEQPLLRVTGHLDDTTAPLLSAMLHHVALTDERPLVVDLAGATSADQQALRQALSHNTHRFAPASTTDPTADGRATPRPVSVRGLPPPDHRAGNQCPDGRRRQPAGMDPTRYGERCSPCPWPCHRSVPAAADTGRRRW